jgi:hypothetical protein
MLISNCSTAKQRERKRERMRERERERERESKELNIFRCISLDCVRNDGE